MKALFAFTVIFLVFFSGCKDPTYSPAVLAEYSLGSGGNCTGATISGRYVADTALTSANTVTITVDVKVAGPYGIATNTVNGISFSQAGTFNATGPQVVVLTGTGTPVDTVIANFIVKALDGSGDSCIFSVATVQGVPPHYYLTCLFYGVYRNFSDSAYATNSDLVGSSGAAGLYVRGLDTIVNSTSKIELGVNSAGSVGPGTYTDTSFNKAYFNYLDSPGQTWSVNSSNGPSFTIVLTGVSANNVQGTFSGTIKDQQGFGTDSIVVSNGLFYVPVK